MIMLPSSAEDFTNPEARAIIEKTMLSPATDAEGRVKLFKLAWDSVGSEFASRHTQYEMFYSGARHFVTGHAYRTYNWDASKDLVEHVLADYERPADLKGAAE